MRKRILQGERGLGYRGLLTGAFKDGADKYLALDAELQPLAETITPKL